MLFVYGTLRDPDVLGAVLGRSATGLNAAAPGYAVVYYPGRVYPALLRRPGAAAPGRVLTDISLFEIDLLDAFEGDEYRREIIAVMIDEELHEAFAYMPVVAVAGQPDWTLPTWQAEHKARILAGERATAEQLRAKLIASRPH
jgi:gamma-glutamylcyclotransferase (GGCT)/AIG2-like uncharacterized protein YtfP